MTRKNEEAESAKLRAEAEAATLREKEQAGKATAANQKKQNDTWMALAAAVTLFAMVFAFRGGDQNKARARAIYAAADTNHDGHLSHKELIDYIVDNKNAENAELREVLKADEQGFSKRVHNFFKTMDADGESQISE